VPWAWLSILRLYSGGGWSCATAPEPDAVVARTAVARPSMHMLVYLLTTYPASPAAALVRALHRCSILRRTSNPAETQGAGEKCVATAQGARGRPGGRGKRNREKQEISLSTCRASCRSLKRHPTAPWSRDGHDLYFEPPVCAAVAMSTRMWLWQESKAHQKRCGMIKAIFWGELRTSFLSQPPGLKPGGHYARSVTVTTPNAEVGQTTSSDGSEGLIKKGLACRN